MKKLLLLPAAIGGCAAVFAAELYRYTFRRESSPLLAPFLDKKGHEEAYYRKRDAAAEELRRLPHKTMRIRSKRGNLLAGHYYPLAGEGKRIAFLMHGYRSEHAETAGLFRSLYEGLGFDLFCCDQTAHGESEGSQIGFDFYEAEDGLLWLDELRRLFGDDIRIVLHGFSMGSATSMKMSADCPPQVRFLVEDCGYASAETQLVSSLGPVYPLMRSLNRVIAGYDLRETDVRPSLSRARLPILFVHGRNDPTVPFENAETLYQAYQGPKDCFFVEGARHMECIYLDPEGYKKKLESFVRAYIT